MATLEKLYNDLGNIYGKAPYSLEQFKEYSANSASLGKLYDNIANSGRVNMGGMSRNQFIEKFMNADDRIPDRQAITGMPSEYKYSILDYSLDEIEKEKAKSKEIAKKEAKAAMPKRDKTTIPYKPEEFTGGLYNYGQIVPGVVDEYAKEPVKPITQQDVENLGRTIDQSINKAESVIQPQKSNVSSQYKRQFTKGFEERAIDAQERLANDPLAIFEYQLSTIEDSVDKETDKDREGAIGTRLNNFVKKYNLENIFYEGSQTRKTTKNLLSQARNVLDMYRRKDKNGLSNFFDAFIRSIDEGMLSMGTSDAIDMAKVISISNKINNSEDGFDNLTTDEKNLIAAYSLLDQMRNSLQQSNSQRWGQGTAESLAFMTSFAASGGIASAATKGITKGVETAAKKVIKETARNVVRRATQKGVGRVAANVAKKTGNIALDGIVTGLVMPLTGGIGYTTAEIERRLIGTPDVEIGYDGEYKFKGITGQETLGGAIAKGLASQAIEYGVEGIGKYIGLNAGKLFSKFPGATRLLTKPIPKRFSKTMNRIARLSGFNGFIPEVAEEEIGMILNAATLGETKWEDITDLQNQLDILVQVGIISGGFQIANFSSTGYHYNKYREARRQYESIDYGKGSKIEDIDAILENTPIDQRTDVIEAIANSYNFDNADKAKLANYVMRKTNYDFILGEIQERAQQAGDEAAKNEMRFINEAMGGKVYVTLSDGRTAVVTSGELSTEKGEDGLYSTANGSDSVVVIPTDVEGAKPMLVSMKDIANIDAITPTEQALREAREAAKDMQVETDAAAIEAEADQEGQGQKEYLPYIEMNEDQQSPVYKENDKVVYIDSMGQQQDGTVKSVHPDGVNIVSVVNGIPQEDFVTFDNVQPKQVQQTQEQIEETTGEEKQAQTQQPQSIYEEQEIQSDNNIDLAEETQPTAKENTQVSDPGVAQAIETEAPAIAAEETAPKSEEQPGTDRWAQYRKPNGEVDTKKMTFQDQMEYGEESLGVEEMVTLAKNGVNATQKKINSLQKQYDSEIDPGKKVSKKKQLDSLQERLKSYQDYLEANDENRQAVAQTPQNLIGRLNALGDIRSLRDFILREIASGNAKFKWGDRENGTKGLGSHLGMGNSPTERRMRISLLSNSGYTPEEFAHYIWEMQDAQNSNLPFRNYDTEEILGEVIDVLESVYSPKQALEQAEEIRDKEIQQSQEEPEVETQQEASENTEEQQIEPTEEAAPINEELPFERPTDDYVPFRQENEQQNEIESRQVGQVTFTQEEIKDYINEEAGKLNIPIRIIENVEDITGEEPRYREKRRSKGWFDVNTGEIVIVAPNHTSIRDAQKTILHEAVAHYGLRGLVGTENFDELCDRTWAEMTDNDRIYFASYAEGKNIDSLTQEDIDTFTSDDYANKRIAADEYLASVAENGITKPTVWQKIKEAIKDLFNKIGIDLQIDDADIAYMLWKSKNRITDNDDMQTVVDKSAADAQMKKDIDERFRGINSGYTQREDGTNISVNAFDAEQDGTFTEGTFRKVYGVSKNDFNILSMLGIVKYSEWHHTGTNFTRSRFYSWGDSDRVVDNGYSYANSSVQDGSFAQIYRDNKKQIGKLVKELDAKNWEYETGQEEANKNTEGKEKTLLEIASIFGLEDADKVVNYQSYANRRKIQEDAVNKEFEEKRKQLDVEQDKRKKSLDKWLQSNKEKGNITEYSRIPLGAEPKFFVEIEREITGAYDWYNNKPMDDSPVYVSGIAFKSKRLYDSYINKKKEIKDAYLNFENEYSDAWRNIRFRVGEEYTQEEQDIIDKAKQEGAYLKAPNGADTNLTPKQWAQVRTKAFKDWFGDWENDPKNSSKVVDDNGEPMVVYHGSPNEFTIFDTSKIGSSTGTSDGRGFYFTTGKSYAESFATQEGNLFEVFLDIRNPLSYDKKTITKAQLKKIFRSIDKSEYEREGEHYTLSNYADYSRVGIENAVAEAVNLEYEYADNDVELINSIIAGTGDFGLVMNAIREVTGKSSMIAPKQNGDIHYIVTSPNQIKSATDNTGAFSEDNPDIRFRINKPVEETRNLVAIHNLSAQNLRDAIKLGGFPMPSIAITTPEIGHTDFGDISLVFDKETIDPANRLNKVYSGDAWTPMFPAIGYKLNDDKTSDIYRRANKAGKLPLFNPVTFHPDNYENYINGLNSESLVQHFIDNYDAKQLYLSEEGNPVNEFKQHEVEKYSAERIAFLEKVLNDIGLERLLNDRYEAIENDVRRILSEHYHVDFEKLKPVIAKVRIDNAIRQAVDYATNGNRKTEADVEATKKKIDERVDQNKFEEWLTNLFDGVVEKRGIRNEKDPFTPSGSSRKWESLYDEITLDNIIKAMRNQSERGGQGIFGGNIFGAAQQNYKSINEIRETAKQRFNNIGDEEYNSQRDAITERLSSIKIPGVGENFSDQLDMIENITDAVRSSHDAKAIYKYLKEFYPNVTMETANEISDIVKDIQNMSSRYFEAKPYRAVTFDEVKFAVVPDNTEEPLLKELQSLNIPTLTYQSGNIEDRKQVLNDAANEYDIRFRSSRRKREREVIEIYDIDHEGIADGVKKFAEENFEPGTYDFFTARTGSIYMNAKIDGSNVEVRMANHTKAMRYDQSPHLLGDGFSIDFYKDGSINVSMDIVQNGMTDVEINQFLKGLKEYEDSPIKERVMLLLEGADTVYPSIAEGEMENQLYAMMGDKFVETLNSTIRENHHYALNQEVKKQEDIMQKSQSNIRFTIGNALKDDVFHWYATTSDKMLYDISGGYWFNATNGYLKITPNILKGSIFFDPQSIEKKLVSAYFVPARGVNKRKAKKEAIQEYVSDYVTTLSNAPIYDSDKIIEGGSNIVQARYNIDQLKQEYNIWHSAKFGYPAPDVITRFRRIDMPDVSTLVTENNGVYEVNLQNLLPEEEERVRELAKSMSDVTITGDIAQFPDRDMAENAVRNAMMFYGDLSDEITNIPYDVTPLDVMEKLDQRIKRGKLKRIWIDQYQPLKALQTMIEKKLGITIPENLDAWEATGYMDSQAAAQLDEYKARYYEPLLELYVKLSSGAGVSEKELTDYLLIKHGIERNQVFRAEELKDWEEREQEAIKNKNLKTQAQKDAAQQDYEKRRAEYIEQLRQKDYSGYYEYFTNELSRKYDTPQNFISLIEDIIGSDMTTSIWDKIRAATNRTLDIAYNAGNISKESRDYYKSRFMYYVPLRGFEGDTMDETYSSRYKIGTRSTVDKRAKGRASMADNPLVYIATMAATEIDRAAKNDMKKILLRLLNSSNVKDAFSGHYVIEKSDGSTEKVTKLPKNRSRIKRITHVPGVYQISRKYQYLMLDENGMPMLDRNGNQMWEDRDEEPTPEELANGLARLSYNPKGPKSSVIKTPAQQDESSVSVYINGEEIKITFTNPYLARSVNGRLNQSEQTYLIRKTRNWTRFMANNYTTLSPGFLINNIIRDSRTAFLNNFIEHGFKTSVGTVKNYKSALLAMRRYIFKEGIKKRPTDSEISIALNKIKRGNRMTNHDYDVLAYLFISRGGETGYIGMQNVDKYRQEMEYLMKVSNKKTIEIGGELKKRNLMRRGVKFMQDTARLSEDITRFSMFLQSLKQGDSVSKATTRAKNISTNFNRRGSHEGVNWAFASYAFLNATLQGTYRQWQIAKAHPYRTFGIAVMYPFLMGVLEATLGYYFGGDDDDFGKKYYELSEFKRHNYMCLPTIFSDNFITIPLPQIYRTFHALGCMVVDQIYNKSNPITTKDITTVDLLTTVAQDIMPLQYGSETNLAPTVLQPIATILLNKTFTGAPLYKDTPYNQNTPEYRKAYGNTSNIFVTASKMINDITGGNYAEKGWFEKLPFIGKLSNPAVLQQLVLSYLPGLPRVATQFTIAGESAVRKTREAEEDFSISEVPIAGTLIGDPTDRIPRSVIRSHWYDFTEKAREIKRVDRELLTNMFIDEFAENQNAENIIPAETYSKVSGIVLKLLQRDKENRQLEDKLQNGLIPADQMPGIRAQFDRQSRETDKTIKELLEGLYNAGIDIKSK